MLDGSAQGDSLDTMKSAFSAAGKMTPEDEAKEIFRGCWDRHKPDVTRARNAFFDELMKKPAYILVAVFGEKNCKDRISAFTFNSFKEVAKACWGAGARNSVIKRIKNRGFSTNPHAVYMRERNNRLNKHVPVSELSPIAIESTSRTANSKIGHRRRRDREERGVMLGKVEIDKRTGEITALLTRLPAHLQTFATWTTDRALAWCEKQEQHASMVRVWCQMTADPRKTLGEQLTPEIVAALTA